MNAERYRRWFEYECDSNAKVLASLQAVPAELRAEPFQKAVNLLAHLVAARQMWLFRLGVAAKPVELFPPHTDLSDLPSLVESMQAAWTKYLTSLDDNDISRVVEYQSYEGQRFRNTIDDILTQLFGHSLYHRGQIAMIIRSIGAEPAVTDFVFWARETESES
ncbi:MAG: DinB family protein [bacterium]